MSSSNLQNKLKLVVKKAGSRLVHKRKDVSQNEPHVKVASFSLDSGT